MESIPRNTIPSGIEPVDELLGGLESGQLYLVHGDTSGKSLFGIKFLIEGLKRGENVALVIRYSPEDAVRRFARLGYDCLEDIYSGRLLILEYFDDMIQQVAHLQEMTPVLRQLEWLLGETQPQRLIFDPVTNLVRGEEGSLEPRVREFAEWSRSFGATVVLVANGDSDEVIRAFRPLVEESFRFEVRETAERATRFIAFEKSPAIPAQAIEVDPSRGIFLLGRGQAQESPASFSEDVMAPVIAEPPTREQDQSSQRQAKENNLQFNELQQFAEKFFNDLPIEELDTDPLGLSSEFDMTAASETLTTRPEINLDDLLGINHVAPRLAEPPEPKASSEGVIDVEPDSFAESFDDIAYSAFPLDLEDLGLGSTEPGKKQEEAEAPPQATRETYTLESPGEIATVYRPKAEQQVASFEQKLQSEDAIENVDSARATLAVELLLQPPDARTKSAASAGPSPSSAQPASKERGAEQPAATTVNPKDFHVLVIDDDATTCELIKQKLSEYTVEAVSDGVTGLARLISFVPDLVIVNAELPIVDGFKVLTHIRSSLDVPVIIVSEAHVRASDRIRATELGADYYLTKPFSTTELQQKARQLIARYRRIDSWILSPPGGGSKSAVKSEESKSRKDRAENPLSRYLESGGEQFVVYEDLAARVEQSIKSSIETGASFSIVGCHLPQMTSEGGRVALELFELVRSLVRDTDLISTNQRNDIVILLADADRAGSRAFINRLRERVLENMGQEPEIWRRSFPDLEEKFDSARTGMARGGGILYRRATDVPGRNRRQDETQPAAEHTSVQADAKPAATPSASAEQPRKNDPLESYIDFLEHL